MFSIPAEQRGWVFSFYFESAKCHSYMGSLVSDILPFKIHNGSLWISIPPNHPRMKEVLNLTWMDGSSNAETWVLSLFRRKNSW